MFIGRKPSGEIYGAWTQAQPQDADHRGLEEVPEDHPDLVAFLGPKPKALQVAPAVSSKPDVEDLVMLLHEKGVVTDEDLQTIAQSK